MNGTQHPMSPIDDEVRAHLQRTSKVRFKQNMIYGIGAATVFGIVGAACSKLFGAALGGGVAAVQGAAAVTLASGLAWAGIAALVAVGVGCLYLSSKYMSELVSLEQSRQANQIAKGINNGGQGLEKPIAFPSQSAAQTSEAPVVEAAQKSAEKPTLVVNNVSNFGRASAPSIEASRV